MLVRDVMNKNVVVAEPEITVKEAAGIMSQYHIGSLVILKNKKIVGIITERNILVAINFFRVLASVFSSFQSSRS